MNGPDHVYVERAGGCAREAGRGSRTRRHLRHVIDRIVRRSAARVDESSPMVDARLPDGSRVNAVLPPLAVDGPLLTIRSFGATGLSVAQLVDSRQLSAAHAGCSSGACAAA